MRHLCCYRWCQLVYGAPSLPGQGQRPSAPPTGRALTPFPCCRKGKTSKPRCALRKTIQPQLYCVGTTVFVAFGATFSFRSKGNTLKPNFVRGKQAILASLVVINPIRPSGTFPVWEGEYWLCSGKRANRPSFPFLTKRFQFS